MISFLLRSRYSFILKGTKSLFICGYVPLCSMRRVLWVLLLLLGNGLLPASCVVHARCAQTQNTNFYFQTETFRLVPVVVECVSCLSYTSSLLFLVSLFVFRHVSNTVAVKPIYTSVIDCDDFVMSIEFRLQWWVGGFLLTFE